MKNVYLTLICFLASTLIITAQILNPTFENWTDYGDYEEPDGWNTTNPITNITEPIPISETFVTKDDVNVHTGSYSVRMETGNINAGFISFDVPGAVTNGEIVVDQAALISGNFELDELITGGTPINQRYATFSGFYRYVPAGVDTAAILAFAKKDGEIIGSAVYQPSNLQNTFTEFSIDFVYTSCDMPDTLLIAFASSNGADGTPGSVLNIDNVSVSGTNTNTAPEANAINATVVQDQSVIIDILANTFDCDGDNVVVDNLSDPANGTVTDNGDGTVTYTPNAGFTGTDSFEYTVCDDGTPVFCSSNTVEVVVSPFNSVVNLSTEKVLVNLYPNPADNKLNIEFTEFIETNDLVTQVVDLQGRVLIENKVTNSIHIIEVNKLIAGSYFLIVRDAEGQILSNSNFVINR
ncbi:MAG: T9SS C-terminal target domain-containing protein [Chitinophagaceae bacterium]|nr:MAG: T9SS C-terminal target domain-containing protein [Chitinophagaceae bacterium]